MPKIHFEFVSEENINEKSYFKYLIYQINRLNAENHKRNIKYQKIKNVC